MAWSRPNPLDPIWKATYYVKYHLQDGVECPACGQLCKRYHRSPTEDMVRALKRLIDMDGYGPDAPFRHFSDFIDGKTDGDWAKLAYFEYIEEQPADDSDPKLKRQGKWRAIELGNRLIYHELRMPENAVVFNGKVLYYQGPVIQVKDLDGVRIDLDHIWYGPTKDRKRPQKSSEPVWRTLKEFFESPEGRG